MRKTLYFLITLCLLTLQLFSTDTSAENNYTGAISGTIVEQNGHVYMGASGFLQDGAFKDKQVVYFYQERGQKVNLTKRNIVFDASRNNKYHLVINVLEREKDNFRAKVTFYQNAMGYNEHGKYVLISKEIKNAEVEGQLNSKNEFVFIDDNQANLKVTFDIDRTFTKDEIYNKLEKKLENEKAGKDHAQL